MKIFNEREKRFIEFLKKMEAERPQPMNEALKDYCFKESQGRALIIQNQGGYAVFFLKSEIFDNETQRNREVKEFFELVWLVSFLNRNGYITLCRHETEKMYFIQDDFSSTKILNNTIYLNSKGYYSISPDTICDSNKNVVYKGIIFKDEQYRLILDTMTGVLFVSDSIAELARNKPGAETNKKNKKKRHKMEHTNVEEQELGLPHNAAIQEGNMQPKRQGKGLKIFGITFPALQMLLLALLVYCFIIRMEIYEEQLAGIIENETLQDSIFASMESRQTKRRDGRLQTYIEPAGLYYGIDISVWNRDEVMTIASNDSITFIICKATEGISHIDPCFERNWKSIREKGFILGAYHFYRCADRPDEQADFFWKTIAKQGETDIAPIVDMEQGGLPTHGDIVPEKIREEIFVFLERLEKNSHRTPIIYTNRSFANRFMQNERFKKYPLWLIDYTKTEHPIVPKTWAEAGYKIRQKTYNYHLHNKQTDLDIFFGKLSDLTE